jgi:hypothetical protein
VFLVIFPIFFFGLCIPLFQLVSQKKRDRKFSLRLGTVWNAGDAKQRWDVFMSFLALTLAFCLSMYCLHLIMPF